MIKRALVTFVLLFVPAFTSVLARAQTTYTTTTDGCGGKALQYCMLPAVDQNQTPFDITIDSRGNGQDALYVRTPTYPFSDLLVAHGTFSGFVANPDHTINPFNGAGAFESFDGTVSGTFQFYAYYVKTCSGRGCGGTLGWHYKILAGSTVTVQ